MGKYSKKSSWGIKQIKKHHTKKTPPNKARRNHRSFSCDKIEVKLTCPARNEKKPLILRKAHPLMKQTWFFFPAVQKLEQVRLEEAGRKTTCDALMAENEGESTFGNTWLRASKLIQELEEIHVLFSAK